MSYSALLSAALSLLWLNACATVALWDDHQGGTKTDITINETRDTVVGFARVKEDSSKLPPSSLVVLGEHHVYVLENGTALDGSTYRHEQLFMMLNAKLSQAFGLYPLSVSGTKPSDDNCLSSLPVKLDHRHPNKFASSFCLIYPENQKLSVAQCRREQAELVKLNFRLHEANNAVPTYVRCLMVVGTLYSKPAGLQYDYRFETPLPVSLYLATRHTTRQGVASGAWRVLLTPFTAAIDIVTLPITMPLGVKVLEGIGEGWR